MRITNRELRRRIRKILLQERTEQIFQIERASPDNIALQINFPTSVQPLIRSHDMYNHKEFYSLDGVSSAQQQDAVGNAYDHLTISKSSGTYSEKLGPGEIVTVLLFFTDNDNLRTKISNLIGKHGLFFIEDADRRLIQLDSPQHLEAMSNAMGITDSNNYITVDYVEVLDFARFAGPVLGGQNTSGDIALKSIESTDQLSIFQNVTPTDNADSRWLSDSPMKNLYEFDLEAKAGFARIGGGSQAIVSNVFNSEEPTHRGLQSMLINSKNLAKKLRDIADFQIDSAEKMKVGNKTMAKTTADLNTKEIKEVLNLITGYTPATHTAMHNELFRPKNQTGTHVTTKLEKGGFTDISFGTLYSYLSDSFIPAINNGREGDSAAGYTSRRKNLQSTGLTTNVDDCILMKDLAVQDSHDLIAVTAACNDIYGMLSPAAMRAQNLTSVSYGNMILQNTLKVIFEQDLINMTYDLIQPHSDPNNYFGPIRQNLTAAIYALTQIFKSKNYRELLEHRPLMELIMIFATAIDNSYIKLYKENLIGIRADLATLRDTIVEKYSTPSAVTKDLSDALKPYLGSAFPKGQLILSIEPDQNLAYILSPQTAMKSGVKVEMTDNFAVKPKLDPNDSHMTIIPIVV